MSAQKKEKLSDYNLICSMLLWSHFYTKGSEKEKVVKDKGNET